MNRKWLLSGPIAFIALGILGCAIAAWVSWQIASDLTEERVRSEKTAEYHDNYAEDRIDEKCLRLEAIPMRDCIHEEIEAARDHERSEQDLSAQQAMARFTKVMGWTAIAGLVLGIGTVILIFLTLRATQNTVSVTRETGRDQSRGYLHAERAEFRWGGKSRKAPRLKVWVKNSGQTPIKSYQARLKIVVFKNDVKGGDDGFPKTWDDVGLTDEFSEKWNAVSAGGELSMAFFLLEEAPEIEKALSVLFAPNDFTLCAFGEIRYQTFFDEVFLSQFCFGTHILRDYEVEEEIPRKINDNTTIVDKIERPIQLSRWAFDLKTYEKIEQDK